MDFVTKIKLRQSYWARNYIAWPRFSNIQPNTTHYALARLERDEYIKNIVTQNVDHLHTKAGSKNVIELHGCGYNVICLGSHCDYSISRHELQYIFDSMNQNTLNTSELMRPDGDIDLPMVNFVFFL